MRDFDPVNRAIAAACVLLTLLVGSCTMIPVEPMSQSERAAVQAKAGTVVLYRVTGTDDGKPLSSWETGWDRTFVALKPLEITDPPPAYWRWLPTRAPSQQAQRAGWRYIVLEPGSYRLLLDTPYGTEGAWRGKGGDPRPPGFWLNITGDEALVYAGTLRMRCSTAGGSKSCDSDMPVEDDTDAARALAGSDFPGLGLPVTRLMLPYGASLPTTVAGLTGPLSIALSDPTGLRAPDWEARARERYFGRGDGAGVGGCYGPGCGGLVLLALAYWPLGSALVTAETRAAEQSWAPCMTTISARLQQIDLPGVFRQRLAEQAGAHGIAVAPGTTLSVAGSELRFELQRVQFRQCSATGEYCLEIAVRVRVVSYPDGMLVYDAVLAYTSEDAWHDRDENIALQLQRSVSPQSPCTSLERYCRGDGLKAFETELLRGVNIIVDELLRAGSGG